MGRDASARERRRHRPGRPRPPAAALDGHRENGRHPLHAERSLLRARDAGLPRLRERADRGQGARGPERPGCERRAVALQHPGVPRLEVRLLPHAVHAAPEPEPGAPRDRGAGAREERRPLAGVLPPELGEDPELPPRRPPPNPDNGTGVPAPVVSQYLKQLTILPVRGTRLVSVQFTTPDPKLSAAVANAHAQLFVKAGRERLYESMDQIRTFLQTKPAEPQTRMQEAETKLMKFQAAHNLLPVVLQKDVASERLMDLSKRLTEAQGQLFALEAEYQIVERGNYDSLPAVLHSPLIQNLRENYDRLEVEHALLALKFRPTYPPLRQLSGQLDHAHKLLEQE